MKTNFEVTVAKEILTQIEYLESKQYKAFDLGLTEIDDRCQTKKAELYNLAGKIFNVVSEDNFYNEVIKELKTIIG